MALPKISLGILAHNEERNISNTLEGIFSQDLFKTFAVEIIVVANGCTDGTAEVAARSIRAHTAALGHGSTARVETLIESGKANAWNHFVHKFSDPESVFLLLMDADITLVGFQTLRCICSTLQQTPAAAVCVDQPIKDIQISRPRTILQRALAAATPRLNPDNLPLCGQLYCIRSETAREIVLPTQITCEDGFLRGLITTRGFTEAENSERIVMDQQAMHIFASVKSVPELFRHERWIVAGSIIDMLLFEKFSNTCSVHRNAMAMMAEWHRDDPQWLQHYVEAQAKERGWNLLPKEWWTRRWASLRGRPKAYMLARLPLTLASVCADIVVFAAAIWDVRRGRAFGYWRR